MGERVFIVGMTDRVKSSSRADRDDSDMAREAGSQALPAAAIGYEQIERVTVDQCFGDTTASQRAVHELGHTGVPRDPD